MNQPAGPAQRPWPKLSPAQRFGPLLAVVVLLVGAGVVATVRGGDGAGGSGTGGPGKPGVEGNSESADKWSSNPELAPTYAEAKARQGRQRARRQRRCHQPGRDRR